MNIYDTKTISCTRCGKCIGEIDYDAVVMMPECSQCANPMPEGDNILYTASHFKNNPLVKKSILENIFKKKGQKNSLSLPLYTSAPN